MASNKTKVSDKALVFVANSQASVLVYWYNNIIYKEVLVVFQGPVL